MPGLDSEHLLARQRLMLMDYQTTRRGMILPENAKDDSQPMRPLSSCRTETPRVIGLPSLFCPTMFPSVPIVLVKEPRKVRKD